MEGPTQKPRDKRLLRADELDQLPPLEWLIPGKLLRRGLNVLYGASESCKTLLALHWALVVAQTYPVVIIAGEGLYGLDQRLKAAADHHELSRNNVYIWPEAVELMKPASVKDFIKAAGELTPALVEIDTLSRCMVGGDENAPKDMGLAIHGCNLIERGLDCSVLPLHHKGRTGSHERGHTALRGAADLMIEIARKESLITISCSKSKDDEPFPKEQYRLTKHLGSVVLCAEGSLTGPQLKVLRTLHSAPAKSGKLLIETGIPKSTLHHLLDALKTGDYVSQPTSKGAYELTAKGTQALPATAARPAKSQSLKSDSPKARLQKTPVASRSQNAPSHQPKVNSNGNNDLGNGKSQVSPNGFQSAATETISSLTTPPPFKGESETRVEAESESVVSVPIMITPDMRRRLRECGETDSEIDGMKRAEALALLDYFDVQLPCPQAQN